MTDQLTDIYLALSDLAAPLGERLASAEALEYLLYRYGWDVALDDATFDRLGGALGLVAPLEQLLAAADTLRQKRAAAPDTDLDVQAIAALAQAVGGLVDALTALRSVSLADLGKPFSDVQFWENIGDQLLDDLLEEYLRIYRPPLYVVLRLWGVIRYEAVSAGAPFRLAYSRMLFDWDQLLAVLRNPLAALKQAYVWGDPAAPFRYEQLFDALRAVLGALHLSNYSVAPALQVAQVLPADTHYRVQSDLAALRVTLLEGVALHDRVLYELGLQLFPASAAAETQPTGVLLTPIARGGATGELPLAGGLALRWNVAASADALPGLILLPSVVDLIGGPLAVGASLELAGTRTEPWYMVGSARTAHIELRNPTLRLSIEGTVDSPEARFAIQARTPDGQPGGKVFIPLDAADSFVKDTVAQSGLTLAFAPELIWSSRTGLTFNGRPVIDITLPVVLTIGPVRVHELLVRLAPRDTGGAAATFEVSANLAATIGPVNASVERLGFELTFDFSSATKNIGIADVDFGFKPPNGAGLTIDAPGVSGGGFLLFDEARGLYAGVMQLSIHESITVKAFGLIATRLPDGGRGYSLLVFVTVEDFQPVPLGLGFMLSGIGGMVAIHRTFSEDALREGMQRDTLGTLLFPKDVINDAPTLVRTIGAVFPVRTGSYLFGLLAKITWFTPTLVTMDLALIFEFGRQRRLLILGRISALLPSADNDLVRLILNAVGVVDFDQGTAAVDAVLVDSRLAHKFPLTGAAAFRARWTSGPGSGFILSVGGVNPRFAPPTSLPKLDRVTVALCSGDNPRLTCAAYFAVTANTLQFGARAELHAAAHGFSVDADVGFDVLIQLVPFHFLADFHAAAQLKRGPRSLFKVSLAGELEGPLPLRVSGKATFEILWCDVTVRFDKTLISGERPPLPPAVNVLAELVRALSSAGSWSSRRPASRPLGVSLTSRAPQGVVVVDPLGTLVVKQQVVPLNTEFDLDTFGGAPIAGARRFQVTATLGGHAQAPQAVRESFARSQFFAMTDDQRLSSPSFEEMDAGIEFGSDEVAFDAAQAVAAPLAFEPIVVDDDAQQPSAAPPPYELTPGRLDQQCRSGSVATAAIRRAGLARFRDDRAQVATAVHDQEWSIVTDAGVTPADAPPAATWSETHATLEDWNRGGIGFHMIPSYETVSGP